MAEKSVPSIREIIKRDGQAVPYDRDRITTAIFKAASSVGGSDRDTAGHLAGIVENVLVANYGDEAPTVEDVQDVVEATLIEEGHATTARAYIIYRHERAQEREARREYEVEATDNVPYKKIYEVLNWNIEHGCDTINGLNKVIAEGGFPDLVQAANKRYEQEVFAGADKMIERLPEVRMMIVAGPSSSGKTTTTLKLSDKLREAGRKLKAIHIDHYFFDLEMHPKDEFGDYDYETPQALDLELINHHLSQLVEGKTIKTPHYDFKSGKRQLDVHDLHLAEDEVLLIDCLHGLYGDMTSSIPSEAKFRLYIETLGQIRNADGVFMRWADNRLMRRMIRDSWNRNLKPLQTLTHWHYVRKSELSHIIPFIDTVDYVVNSALPYELPILKDRLFDNFPEAMKLYRDDPKRQDAYIRARRVYDLLNPLAAVADDSCVPENALLREFIGGSSYTY
jgi:uridine kinase